MASADAAAAAPAVAAAPVAAAAAAPPAAAEVQAAADAPFTGQLRLLEAAVTDADGGAVTNARKLEALAFIEDLVPALPRPEIIKSKQRLEDLCERLLVQNATGPLRRLVISVIGALNRYGDSTGLPAFVQRLLKLSGDQTKKVASHAKVAALHVVGELMSLNGRQLESCSTDVFVVVAKHMKFNDANDRVSAFHCLCRTMASGVILTPSVAGNIWKMIQKMLQDKAVTVRTASAHALAVLIQNSPASAFYPCFEAMASSCLKALSGPDETAGAAHVASAAAANSEYRFAFSGALAQLLTGMATATQQIAAAERSKTKPAVTDFTSALEFLEQSAAKSPPNGPAYVSYRAAICLTIIQLAKLLGPIGDCPSITALMRAILGVIDAAPVPAKSRGSSPGLDDESMQQLERYVSASLRHVILMAQSEATLLEVIESGLMPLVSAQFNEPSKGMDMRNIAVLQALCSACVLSAEGFRSVEAKVTKPLLHLVGNHPNPMVQLHASYCLRVVAHSSPAQLFQLTSLLLNLVTVQNAEILGTQARRAAPGAAVPADNMQALLRGLFGHCTALASIVSELYHSGLGVPHDVTSAVLGAVSALLQPHPNASACAQRRSCAFLLLEALVCLGTDWVGQRLTTLFALWKTALGKKPVDRAQVLYQQHAAAEAAESAAKPGTSAAATAAAATAEGAQNCRDELMALLCALRSLHAFTMHSNDTLLTSLPHLHKILVVFLTNISQLVVALPHPASPSFRAKYQAGKETKKQTIAFSPHFGIPEILLAIRSTMYRTFAVMLPTQYSSRFVPLLNMLADDVTRPVPADFPVGQLLSSHLSPEDVVLDLADPYMDATREAASTVQLASVQLLKAKGASSEYLEDAITEASAAGFFSVATREGPASTSALLTPWNAWMDVSQPLVGQCVSPEWEWRCSAVTLLATILNSSEVSEQPKSAVLLHLLKKRDSGEEDTSKVSKRSSQPSPSPRTSSGSLASLGILMYLREHAKQWGTTHAPPAGAIDQVAQASIADLRDANPVVRRLNVEIMALTFYLLHVDPSAPAVTNTLQHISTEAASDSALGRSSVALLCGGILRIFAKSGADGAAFHCPYLGNIVQMLLKLAKETTQPVRLWMLYSIHLCMEAATTQFGRYLKDSLRLATAHILADFFQSPLVLWAVAQLVQSAANKVLSMEDGSTQEQRLENVGRILGIWHEMKHMQLEMPSMGAAFAMVRTEALCIATAHAVVRKAPAATKKLQDIFGLMLSKLTSEGRPASAALAMMPGGDSGGMCVQAITGGSPCCVVRAAAAACIASLVGPQVGLGLDSSLLKEPSKIFALMELAHGPEREQFQQLVRALIEEKGLKKLPMWMLTLKEIVMAIPPKSASAGAEEEVKVNPADENNDEAAIAGPRRGGDNLPDAEFRAPRSATKVFAVSCLRLLVDQADPDDNLHFQAEEKMPSSPSNAPAGAAPAEGRLVQYLDKFIALGAHACSSDEPSLAAAGLRLMLLLVQRFSKTRDMQGQADDEGVGAPLLLVQYEAQMMSCMRSNLKPNADPTVVMLALELLRDVIVIGACNSTQRLVAMLAQPLSNAAFEADPSYCESVSTRTFLFRLTCACEILDSDPDEQAIGGHLRDVARWLENSLRDASVLISGLPLQSIKTYAPTCFSLTDYKAVQPAFRDSLPALMRGVCVFVSAERKAQLSTAGASLPEIVLLSFGLITLVLGDKTCDPSTEDLRIYLRTVKLVLLYETRTNRGTTSSMVTLSYFLDLMDWIWQCIFKVPARCVGALPDLLELFYTVSELMKSEGRKAERDAPTKEKDSGSDASPGESPAASTALWIEEFGSGSSEAEAARRTISAYALHIVAAALREPSVVKDSAKLAQTLELYTLWLGETVPRAGDGASAESEDAFAAAVMDVEADPSPGGSDTEPGTAGTGSPRPAASDDGKRSSQFSWLWLLFSCGFPLELVHENAAIVLKYWKQVCAILGSTKDRAGLLQLSLVSSRLTSEVREALGTAAEEDDRRIIYIFAMLVPVLTAFSAVLRNVAAEEGATAGAEQLEEIQATAADCLDEARQVFALGIRHSRSKVVQTTISSLQLLLQSPVCGVLCPIFVPDVLTELACHSAGKSGSDSVALEAVWNVLATAVSSRTPAEEPFVQATMRLILRVVLRLAVFYPATASSGHRAAMAACLAQIARADQAFMKAEMTTMAPADQQTIQQLIREHVAASNASAAAAAGEQKAPVALTASKVALKLKF
eukprot:TRINITY_DN17481_c0_g1_i1.p1 TRINITY_DN17481_c0_g1~~TRINITY_DN17481_c0_g1_i1.p1  ORF type:complete len:2238 (+),score=573.88 TRINITY_DN17481_c0_g1_i1:119-6832(+)